jgi:dUTP pyrophosphatase
MSVLSRPDLESLLNKDPPIVEGLLDRGVQVGPNGIDLSIRDIEQFTGPGMLGFGRKDTRQAETTRMEFESSVHLSKGSYRIRYNEIMHIPPNLIAIARPRSSLLRHGATVETGVWDSGYNGRSESLLVVHNDAGLDLLKNSRVVQLVFISLSVPLREGETYNGAHQNENLQ